MKEEIKIKTKDLDLFYGSLQALKSVTMDIPAYRVTALIGPSGCGKSTFLRTLNRMNDLIPDVTVNGKVWVDGIDIYNPDVNVPLLRRKIGMVFQKPNPFPMTIYDNVAYGPRIHGIRKKAILDGIVMRSLTDAALWPEVKDRLGDQAQKLSGGQQQRLCIARALAVEPDILLLDESTSALDPASTQKIEDLISELKTNYTIVMVTHNMQQAARVSDWTAFFMMGEVIEYDQTGNLFYKPQHKETERYLTGRFG
ncbi:MAG: phosphate ABC transporter ATP-binding protein [Clostridia bacterium]|nr:phosphate ABC transporter ATP-binding protein [Clostridia bacterium]